MYKIDIKCHLTKKNCNFPTEIVKQQFLLSVPYLYKLQFLTFLSPLAFQIMQNRVEMTEDTGRKICCLNITTCRNDYILE